MLAGGRVASLGEAVTLAVAEHASFGAAWLAYAGQVDRPLPRHAAIALAGPTEGETLRLTNNPWVIRPAELPALGIEQHALVNDFAAVAHAVAQLGPEHFRHVCGPDAPLPGEGVVSIVGPGTGLGVAQLVRREGRADVIATEGGHIGFAPTDEIEDRLLAALRDKFGRVSVERVVSGQGLGRIYDLLAAEAGAWSGSEKELWQAALGSGGRLAAAALDRFLAVLGAVAGDIALAQGAQAVVIGGGLGQRLGDHLPGSGFGERFVAKGRFDARMKAMPVKLVTHPQPGLFGAAAAFAGQFPG
jgi:glucokinase